MSDGFGKFSGAEVERAKAVCRDAGIPPDDAIRHGPGDDPEAVATCDVLLHTPHWCLAALGASAERARLREAVRAMYGYPVRDTAFGDERAERRGWDMAVDRVLALLTEVTP